MNFLTFQSGAAAHSPHPLMTPLYDEQNKNPMDFIKNAITSMTQQSAEVSPLNY